MKFSYIAIVLGAASVVSAQAACISAVAAIPTCGVSCINSAASVYCTGTSNYACECASATFTSIESAAANCVIGACGLATAAQVLSSVAAVCTACA
ncbi:hypothetical protein MFRU_034g00870 [Monilinia fructicola]|uniref:CFEM domain-containing protein n=1 Tax=Monilinia fructicola TaxID=38448 RepID=A0A5M9JML7_MONFR|nr:hypothetical protein EYC84_008654 [Monilinia fructicola]KAG4027029.1 hypothetical protein MFRU_034g00870 [Monilinia fructicola]